MNCVPRFLRSDRSDWTFLFAGAGRISILSGQLGMSETSWFHGVWVPCISLSSLASTIQRSFSRECRTSRVSSSASRRSVDGWGPKNTRWRTERYREIPRDTERYREIVVRCLEGGSLHGQHLHKVAGALWEFKAMTAMWCEGTVWFDVVESFWPFDSSKNHHVSCAWPGCC